MYLGLPTFPLSQELGRISGVKTEKSVFYSFHILIILFDKNFISSKKTLKMLYWQHSMFRTIKDFLFKNTSDKQTVIKNTIWLSIGEIGTRLLKLTLFVYAARVLSVSEWGVFSYALALIGIFSIFSDIGLNAILLREVARKSEKVSSYISSGFFLKLGLSLLSAILLILFTIVAGKESVREIAPVVALLLFIDSMREFGFALNRATEKMEREAIIKITSAIILLIASGLTIYYSPTAYALTIGYVLGSIIGIILLFISTKKLLTHISLPIKKTEVMSLLKEAFPIGIVAVFGTILISTDTIILGQFRDMAEVGYYAAAQKPLQVLLVLPQLIALALLPVLARTAQSNTTKFNSALTKTTLSATLLILIPTAICILFAPFIITNLFGNEYMPAIPLLQIIAISAAASIPSVFFSNALIAQGKQKLLIKFFIVGGIINIALSFSLIPLYGMYGAAIAYSTTQIFSSIYFMIKSKKLLNTI